jgi:hypothetical protein
MKIEKKINQTNDKKYWLKIKSNKKNAFKSKFF